ncbi:hypothetical protein TEA_029584 [Camellia sinensis var. sinensis]|uniref:RRM domain-containing protein n=1 Tax=Camellia sinensis var. sinensis TaxID=542762 RepID=A0A4S4DR42_CAMSN|nr:hypothetical protein TEA_029584 [Camellia sinensis var. sinensis]
MISRTNQITLPRKRHRIEQKGQTDHCVPIRRFLSASGRSLGKMRPIFCGNFEYDARQSDLERLFRKYGKVDRVDMKSGFAFVYMEDERDAEDAIRGLDRIEFGRKGRRLCVEWTKQERGIRRPGSSKRSSSNSRPSKTLFVINFDPYHTRTRDLERHFDPYGKILNVRIRRNFAFIQFESQEDATRALDATNLSKLMDRVISVEYAIKDDDDRRNGHSPDRSRDRSPGRRGGHERGGRSPSPYRRERASPDYGRGRSPSPYRRERGSPDYGRGPSPSPYRRDRANSDYGHGRSRSRSPRRERPSPDHGREREREPSPRGRVVSPPDYDRGRSASPEAGERISPDDYRQGPSPDSKPEARDSPKYGVVHRWPEKDLVLERKLTVFALSSREAFCLLLLSANFPTKTGATIVKEKLL